MKEKQFIAVSMLVGLVLLGAGYLLGKQEREIQNIFHDPKYHTEDMPTVKSKPKSIEITLMDSAEGRPIYCVHLSDSTVLDSMYPEEIANGLLTGAWEYNEMLEIKERQ